MKYKITVIAILSCFMAKAQLTENQIDTLVTRTMKTFDVPGIAVAVVKDGKVVLSKGYGVRSLNSKLPVDQHTLFGIASNSKAFTGAALAMLVDEKKISWDDKVIKHIPEFKMYNDYVTQEFTIRDLLTHRSGLGLGAGDLMIWPDGSNFTPQDIINNIQYLKPVSGFRTKYDYDNLLYIIAGVVIERVSGLSWQDFIQKKILEPLEMTDTAPSWKRVQNTSNVIDPHVPVDGKLEVIPRYTNTVFDAAAGLYSSVHDMSKWVTMQLQKGKYGSPQKQLFSEKQSAEMWAPQTIIPARPSQPYNTQFSAYGLGWSLSNVLQYKQVMHTGGLEGIVTQVTMIPELQLGIIVFTNQQSGSAFNAITNTIKDSYIGIKSEDYVTVYNNRLKSNVQQADKITEEVWATVAKNEKNGVKIDTKKYVGRYTDNWFGDITISVKDGQLYFASQRSPQLAGTMHFYKDNNFVVKWNNRYFQADAHVLFENNNRNFKMKAISSLTDFSYDFHDLDFEKVE
jgi:CubicO group peptidase (beta-lactamase class C family)